MTSSLTSKNDLAVRRAFHAWVRKEWHASWKKYLKPTKHGDYQNLDLLLSWGAFKEGWKRGSKKK